jgi:hypothetical protein
MLAISVLVGAALGVLNAVDARSFWEGLAAGLAVMLAWHVGREEWR